MDTRLLRDIGLTEGESNVYLALLDLGTTSTGALVKKSKISASKVYQILDRLTQKGLVGHVVKSGVRYFHATNPKRIVDYVEEKEKELAIQRQKALSLLPELLMKHKSGSEKRQAEIYEGQKGITNLFRSILDELKGGEQYYVIGAGYGSQEIRGLRSFFQQFHTQRIKKNVRLSMLANKSVKEELVPAVKKKSQIRFLPEELITNTQITLYKDRIFLILWAKEPLAFLIHNAEIVESFKHYFDYLWKKAR